MRGISPYLDVLFTIIFLLMNARYLNTTQFIPTVNLVLKPSFKTQAGSLGLSSWGMKLAAHPEFVKVT